MYTGLHITVIVIMSTTLVHVQSVQLQYGSYITAIWTVYDVDNHAAVNTVSYKTLQQAYSLLIVYVILSRWGV